MIEASWCIRRFFHTAQRLSDKAFLDSLQLCVQGGTGGRGNAKHGGKGGDGGSVIFKGAKSRRLARMKRSFEGVTIKADDGKNAESARVLGESAEDRVIEVPVGVSVTTRKGRLLGEIFAPNDRICVARGGRGGDPIANIKGRTPSLQYVNLDLKLVADVGIVGFPNAGKSTLLTRLSRAHPKIAPYVFTTMQPQLGVMFSDEEERLSILEGRKPRRVTIADMPGLIEGASSNVGLGHEFLKHIERTKALLFLVDVNGFCFGTQAFPDSWDPFQTLCLLLRELRLYDDSLLLKPALLCVNKVEDASGLQAVRRLAAQLNDFPAAVRDAFSPTDDSNEDDDKADALSEEMKLLPTPRFRGVHAISADKRINLGIVISNLFKMVLEYDEEKLWPEKGRTEEDDDANDLVNRSDRSV